MLGKLSIIGAVAAILMIPTALSAQWVAPLIPASTLGALLIPALPFVVPSSEVSLARIWGLGACRAGKFTVVASTVRPLQSSADDGWPAWTNFCSGWVSEQSKKALDRKKSIPAGVGLFRLSPVFCLPC
jgi:hypothetical protein